jgi:hypothetical protein
VRGVESAPCPFDFCDQSGCTPDRDVRKFLAGAFFVSSGILFYFYLAVVSVPLLGTGFVETPQIAGSLHRPFHPLLVCFYFGFIRKPKA